MNEQNPVIQWLLQSDEPWTRYRTRLDLLEQSPDSAAVQQERAAMLADSRVQSLISALAAWGDAVFRRHNDAAYPIYILSTLADFGVKAGDSGMPEIIAAVMQHRSDEGAFQSLVNIPKSFGGSGEDQWTWMICDTPTLLYALLAMEAAAPQQLQTAVEHLASLADENGYRCVVDPRLGRFRGPGSKNDPCPVGCLFALKALVHVPGMLESPAVHSASEMLLQHWVSEPGKKYYLFGVGKKFRKLKVPFVWYDVLHVADVLSHLPSVHRDTRFHDMLGAVTAQAGTDGRYTPGSIYLSWKGWSFSDKKNPSPWLTFLVLRLQKRVFGSLSV